MMNFKNRLDIEIETITYDFDIDALLKAILVERDKMGVDVRMIPDKTADSLLIPIENFCDSGVGLFRTDLSLTELPIDRLPVP